MALTLTLMATWLRCVRAEEHHELQRRVRDLCTRLLTARGSPATSVAFETLAWIEDVSSADDVSAADEANGVSGTPAAVESGSAARLEPNDAARFAAPTAHRFPACDTAWAVVGLRLAQRSCGGKVGPAGKQASGPVIKAGAEVAALLLEHGCMRGGGGTAAAWIALTRLRLRAGAWDVALAAVAGGMAWVCSLSRGCLRVNHTYRLMRSR